MISKSPFISLIAIIFILFLVYIILRGRSASMKKKMDDHRHFRRRRG
ncbi:MAG: hypothetical protein QUS66_00890 [Bacteroidota bacterium]|jgi:hypothetical protein|nr:hypothetical protein [Bacteroidota bacterium]